MECRKGMQLRAERGGGELLLDMDKNPGGGPLQVATGGPTLKQLGIERTEAMRWQMIARPKLGCEVVHLLPALKPINKLVLPEPL